MCSTIMVCLFVPQSDSNATKLNYSTMSNNKIKFINFLIICRDKAKRDLCCFENTFKKQDWQFVFT